MSRNSASSRALPVKKVLWDVLTDPAVPLRFGRANKGMQDAGPLPAGAAYLARALWLLARYPVIAAAWLLLQLGGHKQIVNRLLEPWTWMTVVVTATQWRNFYRLRYHPAAQPELRELARLMLEAHAASTPRVLEPGEWHLPLAAPLGAPADWPVAGPEAEALLVRCTARCARTSYVNFFGKDDPAADGRLHDQLLADKHVSPFEHCCRAAADDKFRGNLCGYVPYRSLIPGEANDDGSPFDPRALLAEIAASA